MKKITRLFFFTLFTSVHLSANPSVEVKTINVTGEGATKKLAVLDGLKQALMQQKGVNIVAKELTETAFDSMNKVKDGEETNKSVLEEKQNQSILSLTKGFIRSYEVIDTQRLDETGLYEATLSVTVLNYKTPGHNPHNRRKLAVTLNWSAKKSYPVNDRLVPYSVIYRKVDQALNNHLVQTRRFTVLDRKYVDEVIAEKKIILSSETSADEVAKLGQQLGTDYLLVGTIEDLKFSTTTKTLRATGNSRTVQSGYATIHYRILVMATRQIKWSDTVTVKVSDLDFSKVGDDSNLRFEHLLDSTAGEISKLLLANIFPARVVGKAGSGEVIINQGGKSFDVGQVMTVYELGAILKDPYTGESLGRSESEVAKLKIKRIEAKLSYATIESEGFNMLEGTKYIVRKSSEKTTSNNESERPTVILPF